MAFAVKCFDEPAQDHQTPAFRINRHASRNGTTDGGEEFLLRGKVFGIEFRVPASEIQPCGILGKAFAVNGSKKAKLRPCPAKQFKIIRIIEAKRGISGHTQWLPVDSDGNTLDSTGTLTISLPHNPADSE